MWEETGGITLFVNDVIKLETCAKKNPVVGMMNWLKSDLFQVFFKTRNLLVCNDSQWP